jgi:hypothetical protein
VNASEKEKHYTSGQSHHNHLFSLPQFKIFSKIMTGGQKLWKELLSAEGQPTKAVLAQMSMGVFFTRSVSDTIFAILFFPLKLPEDHLANHNLRNTAI